MHLHQAHVRLLRFNGYLALIIIAISLVIATSYTLSSPLLKPDLRLMFIDAINKNNVVSNNVSRFEKLRKILPSHSTVGYLDNSSLNLHGIDSVAFFQTQYALAPVLVASIGSGAKIIYPFVVGDFTEPVNLSALSSKMHLEIVQDFGNGVILFRNKEVTQ